MNHLYIEKTLQRAYTTAFFYLFQDTAVRDVLNNSVSNHGVPSVALAFVNNVQSIDVKLSRPLSNIMSILFGAGILFGLAMAILLCGNQREAKLQQSLDAHNIAEALINDTKFPPLLLRPTVDVNEIDVEKY